MSPSVHLPLTSDVSAVGAEVRQHGPHRFVTTDGRTGYQPLSRTTELRAHTGTLRGPAWSIAMWVCPLEDLDVTAPLHWFLDKDPHAQRYALVTDTAPPGDLTSGVFTWHWMSQLRPAMMAKLTRGMPRFGSTLPASVHVEHLPLDAATWYRFVLTYSRADHRMCAYVNGVLAGISDYEFVADEPGDTLYIGNPAMVFSDVTLSDRALGADELAADFTTTASPRSVAATAPLRALFEPGVPRPATWSTDDSWTTTLEADLTEPADLDGWVQHGCLREPHRMKELTTTPEGLLLHTPDEIADESRMYLWSPRTFEGDLAVEFDFRVEQDSGFGMLVVQASGMQREDFLTDHPQQETGAMELIARDRVRNYYWGFFRRTATTSKHISSHTLVKNPWVRNLALSASEPLALGEWNRLLFVQEGRRLRGALNGVWVVEASDDPHQNHGPVLNTGRIALRLMYQTRMRFRNLRVRNRPTATSALFSINGSYGHDQGEPDR